MRDSSEDRRAVATHVVDRPRTPRRFGFTNLMFVVFSGYLVWLVFQGQVTAGHAGLMIGIWAAMLIGHAAFRRWWARPIDATPVPDGAPPPHAPGDTTGESIAFPIALSATILGTLAVLGFPGGGASTGIAFLAVIAVGGWLALRRAIDGR